METKFYNFCIYIESWKSPIIIEKSYDFSTDDDVKYLYSDDYERPNYKSRYYINGNLVDGYVSYRSLKPITQEIKNKVYLRLYTELNVQMKTIKYTMQNEKFKFALRKQKIDRL